MNTKIDELRKQVKVDMHLHNVEDIKAMEGCFGFEGGNKIVNDYMEKFAELIVLECTKAVMDGTKEGDHYAMRIENHFDNGTDGILHFGVEE